MSIGRVIGWLAATMTVAAVLAAGAAAAPPTIERFDVDESFPDEFLTEECGVPVTSTVMGHVIVRTFPGEGTGVVELRTISIGIVARAGDNVYRFRDVGADLLRVEPDGTAILTITGQVPFEFSGALKIDFDTGETILEPQHSLGGRLEEACATLTA